MSAVEEAAAARARVPARAESVGSLLRPEAMKEPFARAYGGGVYAEDTPERHDALVELERLAHEATPELVRRQIEAGLDVVTDGEMRRSFFINSLMDAVGGIDLKTEEVSEDAAVGRKLDDDPTRRETAPPVPVAFSRLFKRANPAREEARTLSETTPYPKKLTFPAASFFYFKMAVEVSPEAFDSRQDFVDDVIRVQRELVEEVIEAGVKHIQFDFPLYPMLVDAAAGERAAELGETTETLLAKALAADAKMVAELPDEVTTAMHICRGNEVRFFSGSLEPIAERLFELPYDRFLIEMHDTEADGPYDPIGFVPAPKVMVMGLVSTKDAEVEDEDELMRRMDDAASHLDLSQLALSPQCGFSSTWHGQGYAEDVQWRKLELIGRVADRLWGSR